jgi:hypothetical protein
MQTSKLHDAEEQKKDDGTVRAEEVLPFLPEAYRAS